MSLNLANGICETPAGGKAQQPPAESEYIP